MQWILNDLRLTIERRKKFAWTLLGHFLDAKGFPSQTSDSIICPLAVMPYSPGENLFSKVQSRQVFEEERLRITSTIEGLSEADLFGNPFEDVLEHILGLCELEPLTIYPDQIDQVDEGEIGQDFFDHSRQSYVKVKANYYIFAIPYTGERSFFDVCPSRYSLTVPRGWVHALELRISFLLYEHESGQVLKNRIESSIDELKSRVENLRADVQSHNDTLPAFIRNLLDKRREKLERDRNVRKEIAFPIRQRPDVSSFTPVPLTKKRPPKPLQTSGRAFSPEPALLDAHYDQILESLQNMSEQIERSPTTYASLSENDIRNILLVSLNDSYRGNATGETFSKGGKSDIFIIENGKCIFIAECKIWKGPASLTGAIDQLLGYATWRNTKTAILLFNKNKRISEVLEKVIATVEAHASYKRTVSKGPGESLFRFAIENQEDPNRELQLAVLVFDIPSGKASEDSQRD